MISSYNEWDSLRHVVVGDATLANWPTTDPVFAAEGKKTSWTQTPVPAGPVPQWIIDETNEDLQKLADTLTLLGVKVSRPTTYNFQQADGLYNYCPRDRLLVYGSTVIDVSMMYPCRNQEIDCYKNLINDIDVVKMPRDQGLVLDAANILRANDRWLFLESASGNRAAYNWLRQQFPFVDIELCNFYAGVHIDSTISILNDGLVVLNGSRVNESNCPKLFNGWRKIYVHYVVAQDFYQYPYASKWIALNMFSVNPHTVIVDQGNPKLIQTLEQHSMTVIPMKLTHSRTLGGGFHCVTLDLERSQQLT
jgi:glycine amidinotransferase/scyllo-inosamine-4-phosphate amidinotransferase 1